MSPRMPTLFSGHGSPMNALADNGFTRSLARLGRELPRPRAILAVSAHWETRGTRVLKVEQPKTIHDFGGFPRPLYEIQYPAPGAPADADRVVELLRAYEARSDAAWGLDHGTWAVLRHLYPDASIPVFQLSLNRNLTYAEHLAQAAALKPLRDQGVLVLGSGNITHNLRTIVWDPAPPAVPWAVEFDEMIKRALLARDVAALLPKETPEWQRAFPSLEHYLPLLYVLGASDPDELPLFPHEEIQNGTLSMRSVLYGGPRVA